MASIYEYDQKLHEEVLREDGVIEGLEKGLAKGELKTLIVQICKKLRKAKSPEVIAEELEEETGRIQEICRIAEKYAPEYDEEKVLEECLRVQE